MFSCKRFNGPDRPDNLISKEKMVDILIDSKLLTLGNTNTKKVLKDSNVDVSTYIFKRHNIDSLQFAQSNSYYAFHLDEYEDIHDMALDSLERLAKRLKEIEAEEWKEQTKKEEDSLMQVSKKKDSLKLKSLGEKYLPEGALISPVLDTLAQPE